MTRAIYEPRGVRFFDLQSRRELIYVTEDEPQEGVRGWICYHHPDGQWVTLRKAAEADLVAIAGALAGEEYQNVEVVTSEFMDYRHWQFPYKRFVQYGPEDEWWAVKYGYGSWVGENAILLVDMDVLEEGLFGGIIPGFKLRGGGGKKIICHPCMLGTVIRYAQIARHYHHALVTVLPRIGRHLPEPAEFARALAGDDRPREWRGR